jgi:hypothetical protein
MPLPDFPLSLDRSTTSALALPVTGALGALALGALALGALALGALALGALALGALALYGAYSAFLCSPLDGICGPDPAAKSWLWGWLRHLQEDLNGASNVGKVANSISANFSSEFYRIV